MDQVICFETALACSSEPRLKAHLQHQYVTGNGACRARQRSWPTACWCFKRLACRRAQPLSVRSPVTRPTRQSRYGVRRHHGTTRTQRVQEEDSIRPCAANFASILWQPPVQGFLCRILLVLHTCAVKSQTALGDTCSLSAALSLTRHQLGTGFQLAPLSMLDC